MTEPVSAWVTDPVPAPGEPFTYRAMTSEEANDPLRPGYVSPETLAWVDERERDCGTDAEDDLP